jgi:hypothetical protein
MACAVQRTAHTCACTQAGPLFSSAQRPGWLLSVPGATHVLRHGQLHGAAPSGRGFFLGLSVGAADSAWSREGQLDLACPRHARIKHPDCHAQRHALPAAALLQSKGDLVVPTNTYYIGALLNAVCLLLCWRYQRHVSIPGGPPGATHTDGSTHGVEFAGLDAAAASPPAGPALGGAPHHRRPTPSGSTVREGGGVSQWLSELRARGAAGGAGGMGSHAEGMREVGEQPRAAAGSAAGSAPTRGGATASPGGILVMPGASTEPLPAPPTPPASQEGGGMVYGKGPGHAVGGGQQQAVVETLERRSGRGACDHV